MHTAILTAAAVVAVLAAGPAAAKTCKATLVTARQSGPGDAAEAEAGAWTLWTATVAGTLGEPLADRALAADRNTACKADKSGAAALWICIVAARPCQS
jgi:hypothetical protein